MDKNLTLELNTLVDMDETFKDSDQERIIRTAFLNNDKPHFVLSLRVKKGEQFTIYNTKLSPGPVHPIAEDSEGNRTVLGTIPRGESLSHVATKTETLDFFVQRAKPITGLYIGILSTN